MGENHPAQSKVVVEFSPKDLGLNPAQQTKLKKLLGARWNPETNIAKMSCEQFDHQAQNKRYLGDLVNKLVTEAKVCSTLSRLVLHARNADLEPLRRRIPPTPLPIFLLTRDTTKSRTSPSFPRSGTLLWTEWQSSSSRERRPCSLTRPRKMQAPSLMALRSLRNTSRGLSRLRYLHDLEEHLPCHTGNGREPLVQVDDKMLYTIRYAYSHQGIMLYKCNILYPTHHIRAMLHLLCVHHGNGKCCQPPE